MKRLRRPALAREGQPRVLILGRLDLAARSVGAFERRGYEAHIARDDGQWLRPLARGWQPALVLIHPEYPGDWLDAAPEVPLSDLIPPQLAGVRTLVALDQADVLAAPASSLPGPMACATQDDIVTAAAEVLRASRDHMTPWTACVVGAAPDPDDASVAPAGDMSRGGVVVPLPPDEQRPYALCRVDAWADEPGAAAAIRASQAHWAVIAGPPDGGGPPFRILLDGERYAVASSERGVGELIAAAEGMSTAVRLHDWLAGQGSTRNPVADSLTVAIAQGLVAKEDPARPGALRLHSLDPRIPISFSFPAWMDGPFLARGSPENLAFDFGGNPSRLVVSRADIAASARSCVGTVRERALRILAWPDDFFSIRMSDESSYDEVELAPPRRRDPPPRTVSVGLDGLVGQCSASTGIGDVYVFDRDRAWLWGFYRNSDEFADEDFKMLLDSVQMVPPAFYERILGGVLPHAAPAVPPAARRPRPEAAESGYTQEVMERVVDLPHLTVPVHIYETWSWWPWIDDKIEGQSETAIVVTLGPVDSIVPLGRWQVWVDGRNVDYEDSEDAAIAAIRRHRNEYEPVEGRNGMAPSNWTQDAMDALRRLSVEAVRMARKHPEGWVNHFSEMQSEVCYRPDMVHDRVRGWWELRWPRAGKKDGEILTNYRQTKGEAAGLLCQSWMEEITARPDEEGRAITERILFLAEVSATANPDDIGDDESGDATGDANAQQLEVVCTYRELVRDRYLLEAWRRAGGDTMTLVDGADVARVLQLNRSQGRIAANYLEERGLIRDQGTGLEFTLAPKGIDAAEALIRSGEAGAAGARTVDYDVALTFAGEQRAYVEEVAAGLKDRAIGVFYDAYEPALMWGKDLAKHLLDLYQNRAKYVVIFASEDYARKAWTTKEREAAQAGAVRAKGAYILPARFDGTPIPGIPDTVGYVDLRVTTPAQLVDLIMAKVA